jgi:hypothetical protein
VQKRQMANLPKNSVYPLAGIMLFGKKWAEVGTPLGKRTARPGKRGRTHRRALRFLKKSRRQWVRFKPFRARTAHQLCGSGSSGAADNIASVE